MLKAARVSVPAAFLLLPFEGTERVSPEQCEAGLRVQLSGSTCSSAPRRCAPHSCRAAASGPDPPRCLSLSLYPSMSSLPRSLSSCFTLDVCFTRSSRRRESGREPTTRTSSEALLSLGALLVFGDQSKSPTWPSPRKGMKSRGVLLIYSHCQTSRCAQGSGHLQKVEDVNVQSPPGGISSRENIWCIVRLMCS